MSRTTCLLARERRAVGCDGPFVPSEGLCLRHAVLFDFWIAERQGFRVYASHYPLAWKRNKLRQWLNGLTLEQAEAIEQSKGARRP